MSTYTRTSPSEGQAISPSYIDGELQKIETAINNVNNDNIADGAISNSKLANRYFYLVLEMGKESIGSSESITNYQDVVVSPVAGTIEDVRFVCSAVSGTCTADVYLEGGTPASILNSSVSLSSALTSLSGSVSNSNIGVGNVLSLRATTDASGSITNLKVVITVKLAHVA